MQVEAPPQGCHRRGIACHPARRKTHAHLSAKAFRASPRVCASPSWITHSKCCMRACINFPAHCVGTAFLLLWEIQMEQLRGNAPCYGVILYRNTRRLAPPIAFAAHGASAAPLRLANAAATLCQTGRVEILHTHLVVFKKLILVLEGRLPRPRGAGGRFRAFSRGDRPEISNANQRTTLMLSGPDFDFVDDWAEIFLHLRLGGKNLVGLRHQRLGVLRRIRRRRRPRPLLGLGGHVLSPNQNDAKRKRSPHTQNATCTRASISPHTALELSSCFSRKFRWGN